MRIYIRHAEKKYKDGFGKPLHDPELTFNDTEKMRKLVNELIHLYGVPDVIVASPYRRTIQTAECLSSFLKSKVPIIVDVNISEYLGYRKENIDVAKQTSMYCVPDTGETMRDLIERVSYHCDMFRGVKGVYWFVTHGKIIKEITGFGMVKYLEYFVSEK